LLLRNEAKSVWALQPKFIAMFGEKTEEIFDQLHSARRDIEATASTMDGV
jgi:hypothetical protein